MEPCKKRVPYSVAWKRAAVELRKQQPGLTDERAILTEMAKISGLNEEGLSEREADTLVNWYRLKK